MILFHVFQQTFTMFMYLQVFSR